MKEQAHVQGLNTWDNSHVEGCVTNTLASRARKSMLVFTYTSVQVPRTSSFLIDVAWH